jgi:hypothetical protein
MSGARARRRQRCTCSAAQSGAVRRSAVQSGAARRCLRQAHDTTPVTAALDTRRTSREYTGRCFGGALLRLSLLETFLHRYYYCRDALEYTVKIAAVDIGN